MAIPQVPVRVKRTVGLSIATEILWMEKDFQGLQITAVVTGVVNQPRDASN